jgi:hypothetical protein
MGAHARGIGSRNRWPCVGNPSYWHQVGEWLTCAAEGSLSLLALVPASAVATASGDDPVVVHMTACKTHVREVRRWLQLRAVEEVDTYGTEFVMREWKQLEDLAGEVPLLRTVRSA